MITLVESIPGPGHTHWTLVTSNVWSGMGFVALGESRIAEYLILTHNKNTID